MLWYARRSNCNDMLVCARDQNTNTVVRHRLKSCCCQLFSQCFSSHCNTALPCILSILPSLARRNIAPAPGMLHLTLLPTRALPSAPSSSNRPCQPQHVAFTAAPRRQHLLCRASATNAPPSLNTVGDIMTTDVLTVTPDTTIDDALELLVSNRITGLPVVDHAGVVVGVVSDWDMLPLGACHSWIAIDRQHMHMQSHPEAITDKPADHPDFFPDVNTDWTAFNDLTTAILKNAGKTVADVMTIDPLVVRKATALTDAAQILMKSRVRRLPVVDADGRIEGVISRGNIIAAALAHRKELKAQGFQL